MSKQFNAGEIVGFVLSYLIFTTILFFILSFFNKLPESWTYAHVMAITLIITMIGFYLQRWLR